MRKAPSYNQRHKFFLTFLLLLILGSHLYYNFLASTYSIWLIVLYEASIITTWIILVKFWFSQTLQDYKRTLYESYNDIDFVEELCSSVSPDIFQTEIINKMVQYHSSQVKKQRLLLDKIKNNNLLLEKNSKITEAIMQITSEILTSGEIDEVLQTILDKAIEIIPNAQKGSILIYNGTELEYRAIHGYDVEVLKHLSFGLDEIFQNNFKDFYEPCIISNPESFNTEHLDESKIDMLRESRGMDPRSILSCAIQADNEFLGTINLDSTEADAFSQEDKPLIKHLAAHIGVALKNARLIERILYLSRHDSMTGIYNRCYFEEQLMRVYQQYKSAGHVFSFALIDINELKSINDTYGHEAGDLFLRKFVQGVREHLNEEDIFARYGGDEFAVIFINKSKAQAESIMNNIQTMFSEKPFTYCSKKVTNIDFGCGITEFPAEASELKDLLKLSDSRMYRHKRENKKGMAHKI